MKRSILTNWLAAGPAMLLVVSCIAGCGGKNTGPKRQDHKAAHSARYHPDIVRSQTVATTQPATSRPFEMTLPSGLPDDATGTPVMFVNAQPLSVQEILEPILPDLLKMANEAVSEREYYRNIAKIIAEQIRSQSSTIVVYEHAKKKLPENVDETLDKEADKAIQRTVNAYYGGVNARYEAHLKALNMTMKDVKERLKRQILVSSFLHERFEPMVSDPPRRDLLKYYKAHLDDFTTPARAELLMVEIPLQSVLSTPLSRAREQDISAARLRAREELRRAREELDSGADFAAVARRYSKGAQRANGGSWGEITPGSLTGSWAKAADMLFALDEGRISGIIETEESSFIVKCGRKTPQKRLSFEEAQTVIIERVRDIEYAQLTSRYIGQLLDKAAIDPQQQQSFFIAAVTAAPRPNIKQAVRPPENVSGE